MPRSTRKTLTAIPAIERATHAISLFLGSRPDLDVSQPEAHVLSYLFVHGESRINEIHEAFGHKRSTLTSVLDRLEKRRLLKRSADPASRRSVIVALSGIGKKLAQKVYETLELLEREALTGIDDDDLHAVDRVAAALASHAFERSRGATSLKTKPL